MAWYDAPNAIYYKQREEERNYATGNYGHRRTTMIKTSEKCANEEEKRYCITYRTGGQHLSEWCNKIVGHGVNNNMRGSQDINNWTMHVSRDD